LQSSAKLPLLSAIEARALGVLIEKERTVPDTYPMSLNALVAGCTQKSARNPVMEVTEAEAQAALDRLKALNLAVESSGGRVARYAHNTERVLQIPAHAVALLALLLLRGPQTAGELRINGERLQKFAGISAVETLLGELAHRQGGALVAELPRRPGSRENRWAHLLCGVPLPEPAVATPTALADSNHGSIGELAALRDEVARLGTELAELKAMVARLNAELESLRKL